MKSLGLIQVHNSSLEEGERDSVLVMGAGVASWADHDFPISGNYHADGEYDVAVPAN
jgi:hypothetical protein